jgi:cysteinyl-tRNA synthetase
LFELARETNTFLRDEALNTGDIKLYQETILQLAQILGLQLVDEKELLDADIEQLIEERNQARKDKNFARADEIRDHLTEQGIVLEDTPQGVRWRRK